VLFPTIEFCIFFVVVLVVSWALMPRAHAWKAFALTASYAFYAVADPRFCFLLAGITLGNQAFARLIARTADERRRSRLLVAAVALDLLVLGVFKYYGFFVTEVTRVLDAVSLGMPLPLAEVVLPVGVSFFTFQAISYVVDVRKRVLEPAGVVDVALYLSFFPHLVAGPIVRAREFLPQLARPRDPREIAGGAGVVLIVVGLVKKVALADHLAREVVDPVFAVPEAYASADVLLALYAYAAQIYCDFSGYTDMAIGLALLLGIRFPQNFDRPYRARSFRDFWRRWHMTLSRFLRDFVYIPLGGNRRGRRRAMVNVMLTMTLGGLWHGAALGFVLWGILHGGLQAVEMWLRDRVRWRPPDWAAWAIVFHLVVLAWVPFRAPDLDLAGALLGRLAAPGPATLWAPGAVLITLLVLGTQLLPPRPLDALRERVEGLRPTVLGAGLATAIVLTASTIPSQGVPPFIYFQF
jgi:D-alanyl-lipoteichoic acid acyltransferase DltB (MBOAT superfamily)